MTSLANPLNVFAGENGMKDFLNPDRHLPTPLVELDRVLNPYVDQHVRIFAKVAFLSPLLTDKWSMGYLMLKEAYDAGDLEGVVELIENSSGGTALVLKIVGEVVFGISKLKAIVPSDMAPGKLETLRLLGVQYMFSKDIESGLSGPDEAARLGKEPGRHSPGQYKNQANVRANARWLAAQIWEQTKGKITRFYAPLGTCAHALGPSDYFRGMSDGVEIVGVTAKKDQVPGARTLQRIKNDVKFDWESAIDRCVDIDPVEAYRKSLALWRRGILGGPSTGLVFAGAIDDLEATRADWDSNRNEDGDIVAVFPCIDPTFLYAEKYSTHLDDADLV